MTGVQMLLKSVGLEPEKVQQTYNQITTQLPHFLNALGAKVTEIEHRLSEIETAQKRIMQELGIYGGTGAAASNGSEHAAAANGSGA